jgi:electron-transferring-flavoprotein dehydrogenase
MYYLTRRMRIRLPLPSEMKNHGNYIGSLNEFTRWLGRRAEEAGVELYPGFGGSQVRGCL